MHRNPNCLLCKCPLILESDICHFFWSDGGLSQSQDDSIVGTRHCRHSLAIMPIPGTLSSSSPDLLQPTTSMLDFSNPSGNVSMWHHVARWVSNTQSLESYATDTGFACRFYLWFFTSCKKPEKIMSFYQSRLLLSKLKLHNKRTSVVFYFSTWS